MLRVAHLGPPIARQGGPAGYLLQLRAAAPLGAAAGVLFPDEATPADVGEGHDVAPVFFRDAPVPDEIERERHRRVEQQPDLLAR